MNTCHRKKKLVFYAESTAVGGDSKYLYELVNSLKCKGYDIKCFCNQIIFVHLREKIDKEISIEIIKTKHAEYPKLSKGNNNFIIRKLKTFTNEIRVKHFQFLRSAYIFINTFRIYGVFKKEDINILHVNNGGYPAAEGCIGALFAAKLVGVDKVIISIHNLARERYKWISVLERAIDKLVSKSVGKIIVATESVKDSLVQKRGFPQELITKISYGVVCLEHQWCSDRVKEEFRIEDNRKILIVTARFDGTKGQEYLLDALSLLKEKYLCFTCFLLGDGPLLQEMIELSKKLKLQSYVVFTGYRKDVSRFLSVSDVLIQPSIAYENSPYAVLEAMSYGLPVIGTSVGGIPELVDNGKTGFIIPPKNSKAIFNALNYLLKNGKKTREMGRMGRERVTDKFNMDFSVRKTIECYSNGGLQEICQK